jgi:hypothetical protein
MTPPSPFPPLLHLLPLREFLLDLLVILSFFLFTLASASLFPSSASSPDTMSSLKASLIRENKILATLSAIVSALSRVETHRKSMNSSTSSFGDALTYVINSSTAFLS